MSSIADTLRAAIVRLGSDDARAEAELLLTATLDCSRAFLIAHRERLLSDLQSARFQSLLERRLRGEPIAYLLGSREFYGLPLMVDRSVLIPRPDTELLVELALARLSEHEPVRVLDLGTGSGAIALAIAHHRPLAEVTAIDCSEPALQTARANAERLRLDNVRLFLGDWFAPIPNEAAFDLIASNPPYIAGADPHLDIGDLRFEPRLALTPEGDGLDAIRRIVQSAPAYLKPGGHLLIEHGFDQGEAVRAILAAHAMVEIETMRDLGDRDRVTLARRASSSA